MQEVDISKISPDDLEISFNELWSHIPVDTDSLLKTYLFRGWYLTTIAQGNKPNVKECPCCQRPFEKKYI